MRYHCGQLKHPLLSTNITNSTTQMMKVIHVIVLLLFFVQTFNESAALISKSISLYRRFLATTSISNKSFVYSNYVVLLRNNNNMERSFNYKNIEFTKFSLSSRSSSNDNNDEGWDDEPIIEVGRQQELASLRSQMDLKSKNSNTRGVDKVQLETNKEAEERDLFIPIFALVSLAGLFCAYGFEMLRLYSRGELYLPGLHN